MDQASASPVASCAHNPAAPRTLPSWLPSEGQARTVVPSRDGSAPQSVPHSEPVHIVPRPSSPALCQSDAKGYLLPDYHSGATGIPGRFSEGLLLRRLQILRGYAAPSAAPPQPRPGNHPSGPDPEARLSRPKLRQQRSDQARKPVNSEQDSCSLFPAPGDADGRSWRRMWSYEHYQTPVVVAAEQLLRPVVVAK